MKKLITLLAIVLTVQCMAQGKDSIHFNIDDRYRRITALKSLDDLIPETPITIEDIERWIEYCNNKKDTIGISYILSESEDGFLWMSKDILFNSGKIHPSNDSYIKSRPITKPKDPNDIVGLLKWLKQTK